MKYKIFIPKSIYSEAQIIEVNGYRVDFNLPYTFFAAKQYPNGLWAIYEEKSGGRVSSFERTKKEAISAAKSKLENYSNILKEAVEAGIKDREEFEKSLDK